MCHSCVLSFSLFFNRKIRNFEIPFTNTSSPFFFTLLEGFLSYLTFKLLEINATNISDL